MVRSHCGNCGDLVDEAANYCPNCGDPLAGEKEGVDADPSSELSARSGALAHDGTYPQRRNQRSEPPRGKRRLRTLSLGVVTAFLTLAVLLGDDTVDNMIGAILLIAGLAGVVLGVLRTVRSYIQNESVRRSLKLVGGGTATLFLGYAAINTGPALVILGLCVFFAGLAWFGIGYKGSRLRRFPMTLIGLALVLTVAGSAMGTTALDRAVDPATSPATSPNVPFTGDPASLVLLAADLPAGWRDDPLGTRQRNGGYQGWTVWKSRTDETLIVVSWVRVFSDALIAKREFDAMVGGPQQPCRLTFEQFVAIYNQTEVPEDCDSRFVATFVVANVLATVTTFEHTNGSYAESVRWAKVMESKIAAATKY